MSYDIEKLESDLNKMLLSMPAFRTLLPRMPNMRYFQEKGDNYTFVWTTEPCIEKGKKKFYACVYRVLKDGTWKLKRKLAFARRKVAKKRAKKWFQQRQERLKK